ncbi:pyridoxal-phosphate dependent enzyme [Saccharopolyspora sp. WRP15-2]|uniref:Pyridoxal-phosphate dependent enzyme n=1 Tax=Saccharopolyspora oryzae TaxID=2997343 RepID=A0ABT4VAV3_9PSEU|nr:pyridoxal-phosphate dependent enzyme [Saccharopolyspora oryzae]MDA3631087.1 pyridoxal-phosphate dependent enzyme [Saccharopolyspora oryzae]
MVNDRSSAIGQRSLGDPGIRYPLWPPLTTGCPETSTETTSYPVEVDYDYDRVPPELFQQPAGSGLDRWAPLLPPLHAPGLGEGGTPLIELPGDGVHIKDESRNPTWSHKDRLNRVAVSAAAGIGAPGIVVASSGNHGASAAAFAARAGLRCIVLASPAPPAVNTFLRSYGAVVLTVPTEARWPLLRRIVAETGFHPVSNSTTTHTGHAFGPEGYKTVAYEIFAELGVPAAMFVPTGYGELLFGVWKGFAELVRLGLAARTPRLFACEPAAGGPLSRAISQGLPATSVEVGPTSAYGISCAVGGYRATVAVHESAGRALLVDDAEMAAAQRDLGRSGLWCEVSSAAGLAGFRQVREEFDGPVVCVTTSSGFKDIGVGTERPDVLDPEWDVVRRHLRNADIHC